MSITLNNLSGLFSVCFVPCNLCLSYARWAQIFNLIFGGRMLHSQAGMNTRADSDAIFNATIQAQTDESAVRLYRAALAEKSAEGRKVESYSVLHVIQHQGRQTNLFYYALEQGFLGLFAEIFPLLETMKQVIQSIVEQVPVSLKNSEDSLARAKNTLAMQFPRLDNGDTLLHVAIRFDYTDIAVKLIELGFNPFLQNKAQETPFFLTAYTGNVELARRFVDASAPLNRKMLDLQSKNNAQVTPLHVAIYAGKQAYVEWLCEQIKRSDQQLFTQTEPHNGYSALLYALALCIDDSERQPSRKESVSLDQQQDIFKVLLGYANGHDLNTQDNEDATLSMYSDDVVTLAARYRTVEPNLWQLIEARYQGQFSEYEDTLADYDGIHPDPECADRKPFDMDHAAQAAVFGSSSSSTHPDQTDALKDWVAQSASNFDELLCMIGHIDGREKTCAGEVDQLKAVIEQCHEILPAETLQTLFVMMMDGVIDHHRDDILAFISTERNILVKINPAIALGLLARLIDVYLEARSKHMDQMTSSITSVMQLLTESNPVVGLELFKMGLDKAELFIIEIVLACLEGYQQLDSQNFKMPPFLRQAIDQYKQVAHDKKQAMLDIIKLICEHRLLKYQLREFDRDGLTVMHDTFAMSDVILLSVLCEYVSLPEVKDKSGHNLLYFAILKGKLSKESLLGSRFLESEYINMMACSQASNGETILHVIVSDLKNHMAALKALQDAPRINLAELAKIKDHQEKTAVDYLEAQIASYDKVFRSNNDANKLVDSTHVVGEVLFLLEGLGGMQQLADVYADIFLNNKLSDKNRKLVEEFLSKFFETNAIDTNPLTVNNMPLYWAALCVVISQKADMLVLERAANVVSWLEKTMKLTPNTELQGQKLIAYALENRDIDLVKLCFKHGFDFEGDSMLINKFLDWLISLTDDDRNNKYLNRAMSKLVPNAVKLLRPRLPAMLLRYKFKLAIDILDWMPNGYEHFKVAVDSTTENAGVVLLDHLIEARKRLFELEQNKKNKKLLAASSKVFEKLCPNAQLPAALAVQVVLNNDQALKPYCQFNDAFDVLFSERLSVELFANLQEFDADHLNQVIRSKGLLFVAIENNNQAAVNWLLGYDIKLKDIPNIDGKKPYELVDKGHHTDIRSRLKPPKTKIERRDAKPSIDSAALPPVSSETSTEHTKPKASKKIPGLPPMERFTGEPAEGMAYSLGKINDIQCYIQVLFVDGVPMLRLVNEAGQQVHQSVEHEKVGKKYRLTFENGQHIKIQSDFTQWLSSLPAPESVESRGEGSASHEDTVVTSTEESGGIHKEPTLNDASAGGGPDLEASNSTSGGRASPASDGSSSSGHGTLSSIGSSLFEMNGEYFPDDKWQPGLPELSGVWLDFPENARLDTRIPYNNDTLWVKLIKVDSVVTFNIITNVGRAAVRPSAIQHQIVTPEDRPRLAFKIMVKDTPHYVHVPVDMQQWKLPAPLSAAAPSFQPARPAPQQGLARMPIPVPQQLMPATPQAMAFMQQQFMAQAQARQAAYAAMAAASGYAPTHYGAVLPYPPGHGPVIFPVERRGLPPEGFMPGREGPMPGAQPR